MTGPGEDSFINIDIKIIGINKDRDRKIASVKSNALFIYFF